MARKFRVKLKWEGSPWLNIEAKDCDEACDKAAKQYGWTSQAHMLEKYPHDLADGIFEVQLVRQDKEVK